MKKACIITLYGNCNLGNKLQNYAVQEKISEYNIYTKTLRNINVENSEKTIINLLVNLLRRVKHSICSGKGYINENFKAFQNNYLLMDNIERYSNENNRTLNKRYDYFIVGSDQVWNPDFGVKGDLTFLEFANKNRIAFSASIGVDKIPENLKDKYRSGLKSLDYISVREDKAKEIVEELTGRKDVEVLVDPTMLLDKEKWEQIAKMPRELTNKKYILTYFLGNMNEEVSELIKELARKRDYEIINVMENGNPRADIGPSEFVYLEQHAELICTDSFHSCVFAILMETPFVVFDRQDHNKPMGSRLKTLLSKFKFEERKYDKKLDEDILQCDFSHCENILKMERRKADKFLNRALKTSK